MRGKVPKFRVVIQLKHSSRLICVVSKSTHEWPRVTTNDHAWPRVTTIDHEWPRVDHEWPRVTTTDHEWLRVTTSEIASKYLADVMMTSSFHHFVKYSLFHGKLAVSCSLCSFSPFVFCAFSPTREPVHRLVSWDLYTWIRHFRHFWLNGGGARGQTGRGHGGYKLPATHTL